MENFLSVIRTLPAPSRLGFSPTFRRADHKRRYHGKSTSESRKGEMLPRQQFYRRMTHLMKKSL